MSLLQDDKGNTTVQDDAPFSIDDAVDALLADPEKDNSDELDNDDGEDASSEQDADNEAEGDDEDNQSDLNEEDDQEEDDEEQEDDDNEEAPEGIFDVDGTAVTLEEARLGYLRQSDYTRKTTEAADLRKAQEAEKVELAAQRQHYSDMVDALKQQIAGDTVEPDWALLDATEDPVTVLQAKEAWRDQQDRVTKLEAEQVRVQSEQAEANSVAFNKSAAEQHEALLVALPEWRDETVKKSEQLEIKDFMSTLGFSDEEAGQVLDHRVVQALRFGLQGWKLETKKKPLAKKKAAAARPMKGKARAKPKSSKSKAHRQATERLAKTGDINDAVDLLLAR